jgi:hypothetical protein
MYTKSTDQIVTKGKLRERLNIIWSSIKNELLYTPTIAEKLSIYNKLDHIESIFNTISSVKYYKLINKITIGSTDILYEFNTVYRSGELYTYVQFFTTQMNIQNSTAIVRLICNAVYWNLGFNKGRHQVYLFRVDTGDIYEQVWMSKKETHNILSNIVLGIENKIYFPRNDYITCNSCKHRKTCNWSLSNKA